MRRFALAVIVLVGLAVRPLAAQPSSTDTTGAATAVEAFHAALKAGDSAAAMRLLAPDAVLLEAGGIETRAEYEASHLPADIEFEKAVSGTRKPYRVVVLGDTAWAISTSDYKGTFQNRPVDFAGAELMVLSRDASGWRIRSIHWSSRNRRPPQPPQ